MNRFFVSAISQIGRTAAGQTPDRTTKVLHDSQLKPIMYQFIRLAQRKVRASLENDLKGLEKACAWS
jgi:hypothetical protein